jgi:RNA polymerase sigma factor (sigma-70 family)
MVEIAEFDRLMAEVASGSDDAVWQLAETYTPYIIRAVRYTLSAKLRPKLDSQDFVQTLWASLLLRPQDLARLKSPEELIAYLAAATRKKVLEKAKRFHTKKRDVRREEALECASVAGDFRQKSQTSALCSRDASPSATARVRDHWLHVMSNASDRDREIVRLRRAGYSFGTIGEQLQINEQTARRAMRRILEQFMH